MRVKGATRTDIDGFLGQKRLAVVGVSRNASEYSRLLFRELVKRGYDVTPVNPAVQEVDGVRCYPRIADVMPRVDAALVLLPAPAVDSVVRECVEAGVTRIWSRHDAPAVRELCVKRGVTLVGGYCPFMFLPNGSFMHQCHAFVTRLVGKYPA